MPPTDRSPPTEPVERGAASSPTEKPDGVVRLAAGAVAASAVPFGAKMRMGFEALIRAAAVPGRIINRTAMVNER
jgi:hypothetical protein